MLRTEMASPPYGSASALEALPASQSSFHTLHIKVAFCILPGVSLLYFCNKCHVALFGLLRMKMHLLILLFLSALLQVSRASESDPFEFTSEDGNSRPKGIIISARCKPHKVIEKENVTQWGSSTSPPVSVFSGEDFDELYDLVEPKEFRSTSSNKLSRSNPSQTAEPFCMSSENTRMLEKVVSYSELRTINNLCTFLTMHFSKNEEAALDASLENKRKNEEFALGIMDRLLTIFDNITSRVEGETRDADQIDRAKKHMEKLRRDIHEMKFKIAALKN